MTASTTIGTTTRGPTDVTTPSPAGHSRAQALRLVVAGLVLATFVTASYAVGHAVGSDQASGDRPAPPPATAPAPPGATSDPALCRLGRAC